MATEYLGHRQYVSQEEQKATDTMLMYDALKAKAEQRVNMQLVVSDNVVSAAGTLFHDYSDYNSFGKTVLAYDYRINGEKRSGHTTFTQSSLPSYHDGVDLEREMFKVMFEDIGKQIAQQLMEDVFRYGKIEGMHTDLDIRKSIPSRDERMESQERKR